MVSIIVPVYNVEKYIRDCVNSILTQSYPDIEVILVDDGSLDSCGAICDEYASSDPRIVVIHKQNEGLSAARNTGLEAARGEYILFLDSDDYYASSDAVEQMVALMDNNDVDMSVCSFVCVDELGNIISEEDMFSGIEASEKDSLLLVSKEQYWKNKFTNKSPGYVYSWNKIYRREIFRSLRFPKGIYFEDEYILHELLNCCNKIALAKTSVVCYRQRNDSVTKEKVSPYELQRADGLARRMEEIAKEEYYPYFPEWWNFGSLCLLRARKNSREMNIPAKELRNMYKRYSSIAKTILKNCSLNKKQRIQLKLFICNLNAYSFVRNRTSAYKI